MCLNEMIIAIHCKHSIDTVKYLLTAVYLQLDETYQIWYATEMKPILNVSFFKTDSGNEPVRDWLKALTATERRIMGEDIKTVQFGWPLGMPLVRHLEGGIWEIRVKLKTE